MKANKPKKLSRTASSTPDASSPPAAQPVTTTEEQRSGGDEPAHQPRAEGDNGAVGERQQPQPLPIDVVVWPEAKSAEEAAARVHPAATSLTPEQRAELEAEKLPGSDLRTPGAESAATAQPPTGNVVAAPKQDGSDVTEAMRKALAGDSSAQEATNKLMEQTLPKRTPGAGWFIPPQGPSGFGVKKS